MGWATTPSGYNIFHLLSALQKDIRRGNEEQALYWAAHLEKYDSYMLWNKLMDIASEDIGIANPSLPVILQTLRIHYIAAVKRRNSSYRLFLANAIIQLARSLKSRVTDDLLWKVYGAIEFDGKKRDIPWYAKDHHTGKGNKDRWMQAGTRLENEADVSNPYTEHARYYFEQNGKLPKKFPKLRRKKPKRSDGKDENTCKTDTDAVGSSDENASSKSDERVNRAQQLERKLASGKLIKTEKDEMMRRARGLGERGTE